MEAKDTVINDEEIWEACQNADLLNEYKGLSRVEFSYAYFTAKAQAEITWKARDKEVEEAESRGIRKVVERLRNNKNYKIMVRLLQGGYRNVVYDSDYNLLTKELEQNFKKKALEGE